MDRSEQVDSRPSQNSRALKVIMVIFAVIFFLGVAFFTALSNGLIVSPFDQLMEAQRNKDNSKANDLAGRDLNGQFSRPQIVRNVTTPTPVVQQTYDDSETKKLIAELNAQMDELRRQLNSRPKSTKKVAKKEPTKAELRRARLLGSSFSGSNNVNSAEIDASMSADDDNRLARYQRKIDALNKGSQNSNNSTGKIASLAKSKAQRGNSSNVVDDSVAEKVKYKSSIETVHAGRMSHLNLTLAAGSVVPCILITKIISNITGLITCQVSRDVYSADGSTVLIDKGSQVIGGYKSGTVELGQGRLFVIWNRLRTPSGVVVELESPGVGSLGEAGVGGIVDRHYLEMFRGASFVTLLSTMTAAADALVEQKLQDAVNQTTLTINLNDEGSDTTKQTMQSAYARMLREYANIKPNIIKNQGDSFNILVGRDVLFTDVYSYDWAYKAK